MDIFCPKLMNCEDPISVIADIISENCGLPAAEIENQFLLLELHKVKDLAGSSLSTIYMMDIGVDSLAEAYKAIEIYEKRYVDLFEIAKSKFYHQDFIKTQEICHKMIERKPDDVLVLNLLASSYFGCKDYHTALAYFNEVLDISPKCAEVLYNMGSIYWKLNEYDEACRFFLLALKSKPNFLKAWLNYASALFKSNNLVQADTVCRTILERYPRLYKIRNLHGNILMALNNTSEAEVQYKISMDDDPNYAETWFNLGCLYIAEGKNEEAIVHLEKASELNPDSINTWINLGVIYLISNKYGLSVESFEKVHLLCPENIEVIENLATVYEDYLKDIPSATVYYEKASKLQPDCYELNLKLGFLFSKLEKYQESESYFKRCIELKPHEDVYKLLIKIYELRRLETCAAQYYEKLGDFYFEENSIQNAIISYTHSLILDPKAAEAHWKLGLGLQEMGYLQQALLRYKRAILLKPNFTDAYSYCALAFQLLDQPIDAIVYYNMALQLQPDHKHTLLNLPSVELKLGNYDNVDKLCEKIVEFDTSKAFELHMKLGDAFCTKMNNLKKANYHYKEALKIDSTNLDVYLKLGSLLLDMKNSEKALCVFLEATAINPRCVMAYTNIGTIYKDCRRFTEAIQAYKTALNIEPDFPDAYYNFVQCLQYVCDWSDYDVHMEKLNDIVQRQLDNDITPSLTPRQSLLYPFSSEMLRRIASKYAEKYVENELVAKNPYNYKYQKSSLHKRIVMGYVCSDFVNEHISQLMKAVVNFHNKNKIEVFIYFSSSNGSSSWWSDFSSELCNLRDISDLNAVNAANMINKDGINILVNINGHTAGSRNEIFALRPAPMQILWLGYPATSGFKFIDYVVTDEICCPLESRRYYSENLAYLCRTIYIGHHKQLYSDLQQRDTVTKMNYVNTNLNKCSPTENEVMDFEESSIANLLDTVIADMCDENTVNDPVQFTRWFYNIPEEAIVFCNFCELYTLDPSTFNMWVAILQNVPNSVLWLLCSADGMDNLRKYTVQLNIDPSRIIFSDALPKMKHLMRLQLADVFLDTPYCDDQTKCLDAIWAGIPMVTLPKQTTITRVAASQLTTLGITFTIAQNEKHYIEIATQLGTNKKLLQSQKTLIWSLKSASKLFDCQSYVKELEAAFSTLWNKFLIYNENT